MHNVELVKSLVAPCPGEYRSLFRFGRAVGLAPFKARHATCIERALMHLLASVLATMIGCSCLIGAAYHEFKWRQMLARGEKLRGVITREVEGNETSSPEIEFEFHGEARRFVSQYGGGTVVIGDEVQVLVDCETGEAEELKWSNRWLPSIAMAFFGIFFVMVGLLA